MLYEEEIQHSDHPSSPSELTLLDDVEYHPTEIELIDYSPESVTETPVEDPETLVDPVQNDTVTWININGLGHLETLKTVRDTLSLHPLLLEDVIRPFQRPKVEEYESQLFIILRVVHPETPHETEQFCMVLDRNFLVTFQEYSGDEFNDVRRRIRKDGSRLRQEGTDYLTYALLDAAVDSYFPTLEKVGDTLEEIEETVLTSDDASMLESIHENKRHLVTLRRSAWSQREMLGQLQRSETTLFTDETRLYLRDVYDHGIRILDIIETYREMANNLMDLHMTTISNRMNEIMKVLTIIATIFIPLTFIAGIYGMNFEYMPELTVWWAYPVIWGVMLTIAGGLLVYFRRKDWI